MVIQALPTVLILMTIAYSPSMTIFATSNQADSNNEEDDYSDECYDSGYNDGQNGPFSQGTKDHCSDESGGGDAYDDSYKAGVAQGS